MDEAENRELFPKRVGERLAAARTALGLDLDEVAARTRVTKRQLAAIESGDHSALPAPTYSAGFVKAYARVVGLDGAALARDFRAELGAAPPARRQVEPFEPADPARIPTRLLAWTALAIAVVIALTYAFWRSSGDDASQLAAGTTPEAVAPAPAAAPAPAPAAPPAAPAAGGPVVLTATAPVWIRVYEPNGGARYLDREMKAGETFTVPASAADPLILTGRPQALTITVGGKPIPPLGPADKTVSDVSLKPDALLARARAAAASPVAGAAAPVPAPQGQPYRAGAAGAAAHAALPPAFVPPAAETAPAAPSAGGNAAQPTP